MEKICYLIEGPICDPYHMNPDTRYDLLDTGCKEICCEKNRDNPSKTPQPIHRSGRSGSGRPCV